MKHKKCDYARAFANIGLGFDPVLKPEAHEDLPLEDVMVAQEARFLFLLFDVGQE